MSAALAAARSRNVAELATTSRPTSFAQLLPLAESGLSRSIYHASSNATFSCRDARRPNHLPEDPRRLAEGEELNTRLRSSRLFSRQKKIRVLRQGRRKRQRLETVQEPPAEKIPYHVHQLPAAGIGSSVCENTLPRRVHERRFSHEDKPDGSTSAGKRIIELSGMLHTCMILSM